MARVAARRLAAVSCVWALALLGLVPPAGATFPGATGLLAFQSDRGADYGIWISNPDGSNPRVLYDPVGTNEFNPAWSPNGMQVVLQSGPLDGSTSDLVLVDVVTGVATPLLAGPQNDRAPQFCDSDTVVFSRQLGPANADLYSIGTDGTGLKQLTDAPGTDTFPTCIPNGERIAFNSNRGGPQAIWEIDRDGSNPRVLVQAAALDPDYAPDGSALAYAAPDPADGNPEIFLRNLSTGAVTQRTQTGPGTQNRLPHFAPSFGVGVVPAGRGLLGPDESPQVPIPLLWLYHTLLDSGLEFPELNAGLEGQLTPNPVVLCGNPPAGPPGIPPNPPPGDPGGPKNNSAIAAQPAVSCLLDSAGKLTIEGTDGPDRIRVNETDEGTIEVTANGGFISYRAGVVTGIRILGKLGDDVIRSSFTTRAEVEIDGGGGLDAINGVVQLTGTDGPDRVEIDTTGGAPVRITVNGQPHDLNNAFYTFVLEGFDTADIVHLSGQVPHVAIEGVPWFRIDDGDVKIGGTAGRDTFTVTATANTGLPGLQITRNGESLPRFAGDIGEIRVETGGGRDNISADVPVSVIRNRFGRATGSGSAAPALPIRISAGAGDDRVTCRGKGAKCTVKAGAGNDTVDVRDGTRSVVDGGPGLDRVTADRGDRVRRAETVIRS
jgi:TolB protein